MSRQLEEAQKLLDYSKVEEALAIGKAVESQLLERHGPEHSSMADVYCLIGICLLKNKQFAQAGEYYNKIENLNTPSSALSQAHIKYFYGTYALNNRQFDESLEAYQESIKLFHKQGGRLHSNAARVYCNSGFILAYQGRYKEALEYYQIALDIWERNHGTMHPNVAHPYNNRGLVYAEQGFYDKARDSYSKALNIRLNTLGPEHPEVATTLINLGLIESYRGELDHSIGYFMKALDIAGKANKKEYLPAIHTNIGLVQSGNQEHKKARKNFEKALELERMLYPPGDPEIVTSLFNIAVTYKDENEIEMAKEYYFQALEIAKPDNPYLGLIYNGIGFVYLKQQQYEKAKEYFRKAYEIQAALFNENHSSVANIYCNQALVEMGLGNKDAALKLNEKARQSLGYSRGKGLREVLLPYDLLKVLHQQARFQWAVANEEKSREQMELALDNCKQAIEVINFLRNTYQGKSDKQTLVASGYEIYEAAIRSAHFLYRHTGEIAYGMDAFDFAESSKAILLNEGIREASAITVAGVPDSLRRQDYDLRLEIAFYEKKYQEALSRQQNSTSPEILEITAKLFGLDQQYLSLKKQLENDYPQYYQALYNFSAVSIEEVQKELLEPGQTLLEYMVGDSSIFIFVLQKGLYEILEVRHDPPLKEWVESLTKDGVYGYYTLPDDQRSREAEEAAIKNYTQAAQQLYEKLIAPVKDKLTKEVIIIPDGILGYIPFEALLTKTPPRHGAFQSYSFFVYEHQVSYCYSATLLREMKQKRYRQAPTGPLLAMAPFFQDDVEKLIFRIDTADFLALRDSLRALPASGEEVASVAKLLGGISFYGPEASLQKFKALAGRYRILHLSTHGKADDRLGDYAYLAFGLPKETGAFEKLYARDIYNFSIGADMAVLSACETGTGKLQKGEGIISLARAFAYAGARSVFTTLWQVSDEKTKGLAVYFYKNLKNGETKDAALWKAKLEYLEKNRGEGEAMHPFFWAGLIGIGDMSKIEGL